MNTVMHTNLERNTVMHTNLERAVETTPARTIDDSIEAAVEAAERMLGISLDREWIITSVIDAGITADDESDDVRSEERRVGKESRCRWGRYDRRIKRR